jgi:sterol 3beta-glucosyltransferase
VVLGISPSLLRQPPDYPPFLLPTGTWQVPALAFEPSPELSAFLDAGPPPIYIGFGSMSGFDRNNLLDILITGLGNRRAIFI